MKHLFRQIPEVRLSGSSPPPFLFFKSDSVIFVGVKVQAALASVATESLSRIFPGGMQPGGSEQKGPVCVIYQSKQHQHKLPACEIRSALHGAEDPWELDQLCAVSFEQEQHSNI